MTYEHFLEEYRRKLRTPEEAVSVVKDGDWVDYTCSLGKSAAGTCAGNVWIK